MSEFRSSLSLANKLASAPAPAPAPAPIASALATSVINHSNDIAALKADLEKLRADLSACKSKISDLESCILSIDSSVASIQKDNIIALVSRVQSVAENQSALQDRVAKVENLHNKLSSA